MVISRRLKTILTTSMSQNGVKSESKWGEVSQNEDKSESESKWGEGESKVALPRTPQISACDVATLG